MVVVHVLVTLAGIVAGSVLIAAATRRWVAPVEWRVVVLFIALAVVFLAPSLFTARLPVPLDEVMRAWPWRGVAGEVAPKNPLTNDTVNLFLPWMKVAREEIFSGRAPLWNRYAFSGYPLLANGESAPFSPFFLLTLFVPLPWQITAMGGLKIFVALLFAWLFFRRLGLGSGASLFGASAFAFSVYQTVYLFYSAAAVSALLPAAALAVHSCVTVRDRRSVLFLAVVVSALLAAGHPESVLHVAVGCAVVMAIEMRGMKLAGWTRGSAAAVAGALLGLVVSAPVWLPVLEQVLASARLDEIRSAREMTEPFRTTAAWALVSPDAFGNPARGTWAWIYNYSVVASSYAGLAVLPLLAAALFAPSSPLRARLYAFAATAGFLVSMNWTILGYLNRVPPLSIVANDKFRFVVVFFAIAAASWVLDRFRRDMQLLFLAGSLIVAWYWHTLFSQQLGRNLSWPAAVGMAALVAIVVVSAAGKRAAVPFVAAAAITIELFVLNAGFNAPVSRSYFVPPLPIVEHLRSIAPQEPFRVAGHDWTFLPNHATGYGLEDVRGSDPMSWGRYDAYLSGFTVRDRGTDLRRVVDPSVPELDFLNVRYLFAPPRFDAGEGWLLRYQGDDGTLWENLQVLGRFFAPEAMVPARTPGAAAAVVAVEGAGKEFRGNAAAVVSIWQREFSPVRFRLTVDSAREAFIASSLPMLPGWRVEVNGRAAEIRRVNGAFIGFDVPQGISRVSVSYRPASWSGSLLLMLGGLVVAAGMLLRGRRPIAGVDRSRTLQKGPGPAVEEMR
jgi:hypothetical protein